MSRIVAALQALRGVNGVPTPVASGSVVDQWHDIYGRQIVVEGDPELGVVGGFTTLRDRVVAERRTVLADSIADGLATFWTSTVANGGTASVAVGEGAISTSANATGSAQLVSTNVRYVPGNVHWLNSAIRFSDLGSAGNVRRVGAFTVSGTTPQDGFYFELSSAGLSAVVVKAGVEQSRVLSTSWTRFADAPFTLDLNYHSFEIRWTANGVQFYVDNVVRHRFNGTTAAITATLDFPMTLQSINTSGATDRVLYVRNIGIGRFGDLFLKAQVVNGDFAAVQMDAAGRLLATGSRGVYSGQAGVSGTVNVPSGAVVRSYAAQSRVAPATVTVPGVSGTITVPGSNQAQTQFADNPDPGTMVGPCTFTFTSTAAYVVIWTT